MNPWLTILLPIVVSAIMSLIAIAVAWGIMQGRVDANTAGVQEIKGDIGLMEGKLSQLGTIFVARSEYESRHSDIRNDLKRIEDKVDRVLARGAHTS